MTGQPKWGDDWMVLATEVKVCEEPGHGDYESYHMKHRHPLNLPWWTKCPKCDSNMQAEQDIRDAEILGGMTEKQRLAAARIRSANIPPRYEDSRIWNWQHGMDQQRTVWSRVRDYHTAFDRALEYGICATFHGAPGTGKTHLAIGLLREVLDKGGSGYYTPAADLLSRLKNTYNRGSDETEQQITKAVTTVDLLVVDEVGKNASAHDSAYLFRLMDIRYAHKRPTVLVSNMPGKELENWLGGPAVDRLRENGGLWLPFDWGSQRSRRKPKEDKE